MGESIYYAGEEHELPVGIDTHSVSDGYHSFGDLYNHRIFLFLYLLVLLNDGTFKTKYDDSGGKWDGWFIAGVNTPFGQISYHIPDYLWDIIPGVPEIDQNRDYDGHTSDDVLDRLVYLIKSCGDNSVTV